MSAVIPDAIRPLKTPPCTGSTLTPDFEIFSSYAANVLDAKAFDASSEKESGHLFRVSLETTQAHLNWTEGATNSQGLRFHVTPGFLEIYTPNALADRLENVFIIGMHSALFVAITEFTMFCFAQSGFFADVGDPAKETSPTPVNDKPPGLWLIDFTSDGGHVTDDHSAQLIPRCPERYEISIYLALLMARFVWMHELSHCFNGHVGLIHDRGIALRLNEVQDRASLVSFAKSKEDKVETARTLHALELDADRSALWSSMRIQTGKLENIEGIAALDQQLRQRMTLFGCYAMTWLFEEFQNYMRSKGEGSHPLPYLRLHGLMQTATKNLPAHVDAFAKLEEEVCGEFDFIRRAVPGFYASESVLKDRERADIKGQLEGLAGHFDTMLPVLAGLEFSHKRHGL